MTNHPNRSKALRVIRHETTGHVLSVYRGETHLGLVYLPLDGAASYEARPTNYQSKSDCEFFETEDAAVAWLAI